MKKCFLSLFLALTVLVSSSGCSIFELPDFFEISFAGGDADSDELFWGEAIIAEGYSASNLEVTLSEEDLARFYDQIDLCRRLFENEDPREEDALRSALYELFNMRKQAKLQSDVAYLLYYYDLADEEARETYQYTYLTYDKINSAYWVLQSELNNSAGVHSDVYKAYRADAHSSGVINRTADAGAYKLEMNALETEYYDLMGAVPDAELCEVFVKYLDAANHFAVESYATDFYEYSARQTSYRDYGAEERERFREYVKGYIVPLYRIYKARFKSFEDHISSRDYAKTTKLLENDFRTLDENYLLSYFKALPEDMGSEMIGAFVKDRMLISNRPKAYGNPFVMELGTVSICYFPASRLDLMTVSHELGHYYANTQGIPVTTSRDLMEVHSHANEALFCAYLDRLLQNDVSKDFLLYSIYDKLYQIILQTIRDHFYEIVIKSATTVAYTPELLEDVMLELIEEYDVTNISANIRKHLTTSWQRISPHSICDSLSYAVSDVIALQLYQISQSDFDRATACYQRLSTDIDKESSFLGTLRNAGLSSPFDESTYIALMEIADIDH